MTSFAKEFVSDQNKRNKKLIAESQYIGEKLLSCCRIVKIKRS
jgi:hypothetical protein